MTPISVHPSRRRRRYLRAIRLRSLLLIILAIALGLGWWSDRRRRTAVDRLLAVVASGILLDVGSSTPSHDPTDEHDRGRYQAVLHQVRDLHAEPLAVVALTETLRAARLSRDEKSMRGALAALQWLGPDASAAVPEIIRTAEGRDFLSTRRQGTSQIRCLAVHVLGKFAPKNDAALKTVIATVESADYSFQRVVSASAANELGGLGSEARSAVPTLIKASESRHPPVPDDLLRSSSIAALGWIGFEARAAIPRLVAIARDHREDSFNRVYAVNALKAIATGRDEVDAETIRLHADLVAALSPLLSEDDPAIREEIEQCLRAFRGISELRRRREERARLIAADRALNGRPRGRVIP